MTTQLPVDQNPDGSRDNEVAVARRTSSARELSQLPDEGVDWRRYLAAVFRLKWMVLGVAVLGTAVGMVASRFVKPRYVSQASIWIQGGDPRRSADSPGPIQTGQLLNSSSWVELLRQYIVLDDVVRKTHLYLIPAAPQDSSAFSEFELADPFRPGTYRLEIDDSARTFALRTREGLVVQTGRVGDSIGAAVGFRWLPPATALGPGRRLSFTVVPPRDAALQLGRDLQTKIDLNGNFLRLELAGTDPVLITTTVNATADRYVAVAADLKRNKLTELTRILKEQLEYAAASLKDAEISLENFRVRTITLPSDRATPVSGGIEYTRNEVLSNFFNTKIEREQLRRDREAIERVLATTADSVFSTSALMVIQSVQRASDLSRALQELTDKQAELRALRYRYTDQDPRVQNVSSQVRTLETQMVPAIARALVADIAQREADFEDRISSGSRELREVPTRMIEEARLARAVLIAENLYTTLQKRFEEARLAEASSIPDVRVLDRAIVPEQPFRNTRLRIVLGALFGSLALGLIAAVGVDRVDRHFRYPEQITSGLGLPILGAVPRVNGSHGKDGAAAHVIEAIRGIRLNLAYAYGSAGPMLLTITSAGPNDGKSFIASNLALSFADAGRRTLVIDGDVRRGELHRLFGGRRKPGLTDFLCGDVEIERLVQPTQYPLLKLIGSGQRMQRAPELLGGGRLPSLLASVRNDYEVILVDSPPLGAGVDPYVLATMTGHVLLVVRNGITDRELAGAKLEMLDRLPVRLLGAVLNDIQPTGVYRYYAYSYDPKDYEAQDEPAKDPKARGRGLIGTATKPPAGGGAKA